MTDHITRDEIARILRGTYDREFDGVGGEWPAMADALIAAGLIVPPGTHEAMQDALDFILDFCGTAGDGTGEADFIETAASICSRLRASLGEG